MSDSRYRVLLIGSHPVQYMSPLLRRMAEHPRFDLQVAYCTLRGAEAALDPEFNVTVKWDVPLLEGYRWQEIPNRGSGNDSFFGLNNPGLWKVIRKGNFDAVICHTGYVRATFWIAWLAARLSGTAFLFGTDASSLAPRDSRSWKVVFKRIFWPLLFRLADQVIMPSKAGVEMMRNLGIAEKRITLTPFVVDNDWWLAKAEQVDREAIRRSWNVTPEQLVLLFCAKLQSWKRPMDLLQAFGAAALSSTVLVFAGEGSLRDELTVKAKELGVDSRVRFLGFMNQSQLPSVYSAADLFVLPSDYDPCPVVVCEAMLCGLPVLLSDEIRGRFDLVQPGVTGEIFPCGNVAALRAALERLLSDRSSLGKLGENARRRMDSWSPRENISALLEAIEKAVERVRGAGVRVDSPAA